MKGAISPTGRTKESLCIYITAQYKRGVSPYRSFFFLSLSLFNINIGRSADVFNVFPSPFDNRRLLLYVVRSKGHHHHIYILKGRYL